MGVWSVGTIYPGGKGQTDYVILKTDSLGSVQWQKIYGGSQDDYIYDVIQTRDGGYIVTGSSYSKDKDVPYNSGIQDCWVIKLDTAGALMWTYVLGENRDDIGTSVIQTSDGGYVISGFSSSTDYDFKTNHGGKDCWAFKLDSTGILLWTRILGGSKDDYIGSMIQTANDEYVFAATTASNDGDVKGNHGGNDIWVVKLKEDPLSVAGVVADNSVSFYPNPADDNLTIKLGAAGKGALFSINDITGKKLKEGKLDAAVTVLSVKDLPAGVYLLCIEGRPPFKLVKQ